MHSPPNDISRRRHQSGGFTLIEIIAVVMIIGLLTTLVGVNIAAQITSARINATRAQIAQIENTLEMYHIAHGRYPPSSLYGDGRAGEQIAAILANAEVRVQKRLAY